MTPEQFAAVRKARLVYVNKRLDRQDIPAVREMEDKIRTHDQLAIQAVATRPHAEQRRILTRCGISLKRIAWLGQTL